MRNFKNFKNFTPKYKKLEPFSNYLKTSFTSIKERLILGKTIIFQIFLRYNYLVFSISSSN